MAKYGYLIALLIEAVGVLVLVIALVKRKKIDINGLALLVGLILYGLVLWKYKP